MAYVEAALNIGANAIASAVTALSLHSGDPGPAGTANELSGGSPAYARQAPAYDTADDGTATLAAAEEFNVPVAATVSHFGQWAGSTFLGGFDLDGAPEVFAQQGVYRLTAQPVTVAAG